MIVDEGNLNGISCPADVKLFLKMDAKVMIVWSLSEDVKNGTTGKFFGVQGEKLEVQITIHGKVG